MKRKALQIEEAEKSKIVDHLVSVLETTPDILFAFLFGSFLHSSVFQDIDVGVFLKDYESCEPVDLFNFEYDLARKIEKDLMSAYPIEIKVINKAPVSFVFHVISGKFLTTIDENFLIDFMVRTAKSYLDMAPLRRRYIRMAMK